MSLLARAEMAESKLRKIKEVAENDAAGKQWRLSYITAIVDAEVWDGYQVLGPGLVDSRHDIEVILPGLEGRARVVKADHQNERPVRPRDHKEP